MQETSSFLSLFQHTIEDGEFSEINLDLTETFARSPDAALRNIRSRDINIIIGFFGPENARKVLCRVSQILYNEIRSVPVWVQV